MPLTKIQLSDRVKKHGPLWELVSNNNQSSDTTEDLAIRFFEKYEILIHSITKARHPNIFVNFAFTENMSVNAFAGQYGTTSDYVVVMNRGLFASTFSFFHDAKILKIISENFHVFDQKYASDFCCLAALSFVLFHEYAHISRGHVGYLSSLGLSDIGELDVAPGSSSVKDRQRYLCECDADTRAGRMVAGPVREQIDLVSSHYGGSYKQSVAEVVTLSAFAIHSVFRLMESIRPQPSVLYPPHSIRSAIVNTQLVIGLEDVLAKLGSEYSLGMKRHLIHGLLMAEEAAKAKHLTLLKLDVSIAGAVWSKKDAHAVNELAKVLAPFIP